MSSFEPDGCGHKIHGREKVACDFIVTSGDSSVLLELCEEILDQVAGFVCVPIVTAVDLAVCLRWDHGGFSRRLEHGDDPFVSIVGLVGE